MLTIVGIILGAAFGTMLVQNGIADLKEGRNLTEGERQMRAFIMRELL